MAGQWIDITAADGGTFRGYLALPATGKGPGIVLCQEIFGINDYIREVADYYAETFNKAVEKWDFLEKHDDGLK